MDWFWLVVGVVGLLLCWPLFTWFGIWYYEEVVKVIAEVRVLLRRRPLQRPELKPEEGSLADGLDKLMDGIADMFYKAPKGKQ